MKASGDNTLRSKTCCVYADKNAIVMRTPIRKTTLRRFNRDDLAWAAMAHLWALARSRNGMERNEVVSELMNF